MEEVATEKAASKKPAMENVAIDDLDIKLIREVQEGISLSPSPYRDVGEKLGISEEDVIDRLNSLIRRGIVRRFSATIGHRALGISANAMVVWQVPLDRVEEVGAIMASFDQVTHCYERPLRPDWPYNLYTMVHSHSKERCRDVAANISQICGIDEYMVIFSDREFKKTGAKI